MRWKLSWKPGKDVLQRKHVVQMPIHPGLNSTEQEANNPILPLPFIPAVRNLLNNVLHERTLGCLWDEGTELGGIKLQRSGQFFQVGGH